jgi:DNA helicase IV
VQPEPEIQLEQAHLDRLHARLDRLREHARHRLDAALAPPGSTPAAAVDRDALATVHRTALARYDAVEHDLCFGRLDRADASRLHIGRIGVTDEHGDTLLTDWRAPAARPFYTATAVSPEGVRRRRTITSRRRRVVSVDDEVLAEEAPGDESPGDVVGEAALMAALRAPRSGRMRDIVRTIQGEQDAVIRAPLSGVLVVDGGPGTGKTAVALHRAAYLLFTHRETLTRRGVLLVGPTSTFLRYVSHVLPSLAETGVLARTVGELYPGVVADLEEPDEVARLKGRAGMADVLAAAVADRQEVPPDGIEVVVDDVPLRLEAGEIARIRDRVRAVGQPHNPSRRLVVHAVGTVLARRLAARVGHDPFGFDPLGEDDAPGTDVLFSAEEIARLAVEVRADPAVLAAVDRLWPLLTPERLLADLWASPARIAAATPGLTEAEQALLHRSSEVTRWSVADVPLLDEAAELLGDDGGAAARQARLDRARAEEIAYAQGVLDVATGSGSLDAEAGEAVLQAGDLLDAARLAERHAVADSRTAAERAADDRTWTFGHVVVDEAQEVSPMAWRLLVRRCPTRSMTVVGDRAQAAVSHTAEAAGWAELLEPHVGDRWQVAHLTVSYRTPREVMDVAGDVLRCVDPDARPPRAVRDGDELPWSLRAPAGQLPVAVAAAVRRERARDGAGTLAVVLPPDPPLARAVAAAVRAEVPGAAGPDGDPDLDAPVVLLDVRRVKGLEFDAVLVVEPARIVEAGPRGTSDLYVALTRPTQRLGVLHSLPLPPGLSRLVAVDHV